MRSVRPRPASHRPWGHPDRVPLRSRFAHHICGCSIYATFLKGGTEYLLVPVKLTTCRACHRCAGRQHAKDACVLE